MKLTMPSIFCNCLYVFSPPGDSRVKIGGRGEGARAKIE